jgi:protein phosphatase
MAAGTDTGRVRRTNQDRFGILEELGLAVVCDGMGGVIGGEIASSVAVESFLTVVRQEIESCREATCDLTARAMSRAAAAANRAVRARADFDIRFRGMGTTLVAARMEGTRLTVLNVGDSRAYLVREGRIRQLTRDHSYVVEQVRAGLMTEREAARSPLHAAITRAIGIEEDVLPDVFSEEIEAGDLLLLCSDGLTGHVTEAEIAGEVRDMWGMGRVSGACERLIERANAGGGSDNITCVVMRAAPMPVEG